MQKMHQNFLRKSTDDKKLKQSITLESEEQEELLNYNFSQDLINVAEISNGFVFLKDGSIVKILEIVPINFEEKYDEEKDAIADNFGYIFKQFPSNGQLKIMDSKANLDNFINKLLNVTRNEKNPYFIERLEDYVENTKKLQSTKSTKKRFFYIFSYEGEDGKKSDDLEDILDSMWQTQYLIANAFASIGNVVLNADDDNAYEAEILYTHFNPQSFDVEGLPIRIKSVQNASNYLSRHGNKIIAPTEDYIAPRGINFKKWDYVVMDGIYHTYLILRSNSFPSNCTVGWLDRLSNEPEVSDIDIHIKKDSKEASIAVIDRASIIEKGLIINQAGSSEKLNELAHASNNADYILSCLKENDEELYQVSILITIKAKSWKEMTSKKKLFIKKMKQISFYFDDCWSRTYEFFKMTIPLNYKVSSIFNENSRNMTNSSLSSLYCLTSFEIFDSNGYVLGTNDKNSTLFAIDNFNRSMFANPHIFIAGTSGAGKSFTEMMLSSRMRMQGITTIFILPLKGYEYKDTVNSYGGSFISLRPGGKACLNIMEIRPEGNVKMSDAEDNEVQKELEEQASLLSKKITSILTFISLLSGSSLTSDIESDLNVILTNIYSRFGITNDNLSIYSDVKKGTLKKMPIIEDLYNEIKDIPKLTRISSLLRVWVEGNCSNMNGQTNVDLSNKMIAFDINEDAIGESFLPAFMYLAFDVSYDIAKRDLNEKVALILDEIWKMLIIPSCAKQIFKMIKIIRAYNACAVCATQDIEDCANNEYGRSILTLSAIKIFLRAEKEEVDKLSNSVELSQSNKHEIINMLIGQGFFCYKTERIKINFTASLLEEQLYDPTPSVKKRKREQRISENPNKKTLF